MAIEKLLENMTRDAKLNYEKTKKPYWLGKYEAYYEIYQIYGKVENEIKLNNSK